jgi:hypothetical protein
VSAQAAHELPEPVTLGVVDLAAEEGRRHLVSFVHHDEIPIGLLQLRLDVIRIPAHSIEPANGERVLQEPVACPRRFDLVVGQDLERQVEPLVQFVLPLLGQCAGTNDEAAAQVAADEQFLDEQPGHDRLACSRIVRQQETQRLPRQHLPVDRGDLVRQRLDERSVNGQKGIEQVRHANPHRLGNQPQQRTIAIERPGPTRGHDGQRRLSVAEEQFAAQPSCAVFIGQLDHGVAVPLDVDDRNDRLGENTLDRGSARQFFQATHWDVPRDGVAQDMTATVNGLWCGSLAVGE